LIADSHAFQLGLLGSQRGSEPDDRNTRVTCHSSRERAVEGQKRRVERLGERDIRGVVAGQVRTQRPCPRHQGARLVEIQGEREKEPERLGDALAGRESSALNPSQRTTRLCLARGFAKIVKRTL